MTDEDTPKSIMKIVVSFIVWDDIYEQPIQNSERPFMVLLTRFYLHCLNFQNMSFPSPRLLLFLKHSMKQLFLLALSKLTTWWNLKVLLPSIRTFINKILLPWSNQISRELCLTYIVLIHFFFLSVQARSLSVPELIEKKTFLLQKRFYFSA